MSLEQLSIAFFIFTSSVTSNYTSTASTITIDDITVQGRNTISGAIASTTEGASLNVPATPSSKTLNNQIFLPDIADEKSILKIEKFH